MSRRVLLSAAALVGAAAAQPDPDQLPARRELPDPLVMFNGDKVTTKEQWADKRRPELKALFQHYMYGHLPPKPDRVTANVVHVNERAFGGKATLKEIALTVVPEAPPVYLLLVVPNRRDRPAPAFVGLNFSGNHALVDDPGVRLPTTWMYPTQPGSERNRATEAGRGKAIDVWAIEQSIDRGYAVATCYNGD